MLGPNMKKIQNSQKVDEATGENVPTTDHDSEKENPKSEPNGPTLNDCQEEMTIGKSGNRNGQIPEQNTISETSNNEVEGNNEKYSN